MNAFITLAPTIGLVFFFTVFVGIAIWVMRPSMKARLKDYSTIPLKEDTHGR